MKVRQILAILVAITLTLTMLGTVMAQISMQQRTRVNIQVRQSVTGPGVSGAYIMLKNISHGEEMPIQRTNEDGWAYYCPPRDGDKYSVYAVWGGAMKRLESGVGTFCADKEEKSIQLVIKGAA